MDNLSKSNGPFSGYQLSLLLFILTALFSVGYFHPDEHFQLLEFANYKLGRSPLSDLPWEYHQHIRPSLQAFLAYGFIKFFLFLGWDNPFHIAMLLRILTAILAWYLYKKFIAYFSKEESSEEKTLMRFTFFLWFVPLLSTRFSSENYAALSFLAALLLLFPFFKTNKNSVPVLLFCGFLLGLSFYFRFQIAFAILGLGAWLVFIKKLSFKNWIPLLTGGALALGINILLDTWFYGHPVFTPWNYFESNIIQDKAASFGTSPWYAYFSMFLGKAVPPLSILLLVFFVWGATKNKWNVLVWCIVPFLLGHFAVGHKELRFLFPMLIPFLFLCFKGYEIIKTKAATWRYPTLKLIVNLCIAINVVLLFITVFSPAQPSIKAYQFLYNYTQKKEALLLSEKESIYQLASLRTHFYDAPKLKNSILSENQNAEGFIQKNKPKSILVLQKKMNTPLQIAGYHSKIIYSSMPLWLKHFNYNDWMSRSNVWQIVEISKIN